MRRSTFVPAVDTTLAQSNHTDAPYARLNAQPQPDSAAFISQTKSSLRTHLITLGEPRCLHNGVESDLPKRKLRFALLIYLALERSAPREKIAALLWPEVDEERARHRLNQLLYEIRQAFGNELIETRGDQVVATERLTIDAGEFGALAEDGDFVRALDLYQRPFLDGFYLDEAEEWERWVERKRAILARTHAHAMRARIEAYKRDQDWSAVVALATRWLELDDAADDPHHVLMYALARAGRETEALAHFAIVERRAREDLGDRPAAKLSALAEEIRSGKLAPVSAAKTDTLPPVVREAPIEAVEQPEESAPLRRRVASGKALVIAGIMGALIFAAIGWYAATRSDSCEPGTTGCQTERGAYETDGATALLDEYERGERAFGQWQLAQAADFYRAAILKNPSSPRAHWRLVQVMQIRGDTSVAFQQATAAALAHSSWFTIKDRLFLSAADALARENFAASCEAFDELVALDSLNFLAWLGLGDCKAFDPLVVPDLASPSGWAFRSSQHAAVEAYRRALALTPLFNLALVEFGAVRLNRLLSLDPSDNRRGTSDGGLRMRALPALDHDTLYFVPYPDSVFPRGRPGSHDGYAAGMNRIREIALEIATHWVEASPEHPGALAAHALALESLGSITPGAADKPSALSSIRKARSHAPDSLQLQLAAIEARLLLKAGEWRRFRRMAESVLDDAENPTARDAEYLASLSALLGRTHRTAELVRAWEPILRRQQPGVPTPVLEDHLRLLGYSAVGAPADSMRVLFRRVEEGIRVGIEANRQASVLQQLNTRPALLAFPAIGVTTLHDGSPTGWWPLRIQEAAARRDYNAVRARIAQYSRDNIAVGPQPTTLDVAHQLTLLSLQIGDTAVATAILDWVLEHPHAIHTGISTQVAQAGALVPMMALRAELAAAAGDEPTMTRWQRAVRELWADADPEPERLRSGSRSRVR